MNDSIRSLTRILAASLLVAAPAVVLAQTGGDLARTYPTVTPRSALVMPSAAQQTAINAMVVAVQPRVDAVTAARTAVLEASLTAPATIVEKDRKSTRLNSSHT